jgi:hypothetical protein
VRLAGIVLALLLWVAAPAVAVEIPATSAMGWPHGRTSNDPPSNVIDGNPATWTWTTEANTVDAPAYLAIGFESTRVNRLRLVKDRAGGGGQDVKDLQIEYTSDDGPLDTRRWQPVFGMVNGFHGTELLDATTVTGNGVVLGDVHSGAASLTFDQVTATGLRIAFRNPSSAGTCSSNPAGPCNHYRVAEFEAHYDTDTVPTPAPAVPPGSVPGQPAIVGRPLFRIVSIDPNAEADFISSQNMQSIDARVGFVLGAGDEVRVVNRPGSFTLARIRLQAVDGGATFTVRGTVQYRGGDPGPTITPGYFMADPVVPVLDQGFTEVSTQGARVQARDAAAATAAARTPLARVDVTGGVAEVDHAKAANETTVSSVRGTVRVTPATGPPFALVPGQRVRITRTGAGRPGPAVTDLGREIPSPREVRAGPATATAPGVISLGSLKRSKCVRVAVVSVRPARVLVTIFSGRRSIRLFGQRLVRFAKPGRTSVCILVPKRAKTFDVRTPLRFAVGYALGAGARPGQRATRPTITPIRLVP